MEAKVLVVEDDPVTLDLLAMTFDLDGWTVFRATDAFEAMKVARDELPEVIVSDVMMPGRSGLELVGDLAEDDATKHIPVILLSARALSNEIEEGKASGAEAYLTKPFDPDELSRAVAAMVERHRESSLG